jgi:glyoxylate/hydroxypyruvate reductase A
MAGAVSNASTGSRSRADDLSELAAFGQHWHHGSGADAWTALAARADVVINLMPLTAATQGFFDSARFAGFKHGAGFVNLARGAAVVDADLIAALDAGQLGHAVLDVFRREPLAADHPFWRHPAITVLPHVAALTDPRSASRIAAANIELVRGASGAALPGGVAGLVNRKRGY